MERPTLRARRSMRSMPWIVFFAGKRTRMRRYPGMKRRKGRPRITRSGPSTFKSVRGMRMVLHRRQRIMSTGYFT